MKMLPALFRTLVFTTIVFSFSHAFLCHYRHHHAAASGCKPRQLALKNCFTPQEENILKEFENLLINEMKPCVACIPLETKPEGLLSSRIGGHYAWPRGKPLPTFDAGIVCLIQINLAEIPRQYDKKEFDLSILPKRGIFQVFCETNYDYGYRYGGKSDANGKGFLVVLHDEKQEFTSKPNGSDETDWMTYKRTPFGCTKLRREGRAIRLEVRLDSLSCVDYRVDQFWRAHEKQLSDAARRQLAELDDQLTKEDDDETDAAAWLLGHTDFMHQTDCREFMAEPSSWEALITFVSFSHDRLYMWGDVGLGTIFLPNMKERGLDFSDAYYTWDCG